MTRKAVLFDMDGTLVDSEETHYETMAAAVAEHGYSVPPGFAKAITGMTMADCHTYLVKLIGLHLSLDEFVAAKYAHYLRQAPGLKMRPGARAAIDLLRARGAEMAIVSNSDRMLADANLRAVSLQWPDLVTVTRNDVRLGKPHAEPYLRAAYLLDLKPEDCIVVEDSAPGAKAGLAAGMRVIAWPEKHRPDIVFPEGVVMADPDDITPVLAACLFETFVPQL